MKEEQPKVITLREQNVAVLRSMIHNTVHLQNQAVDPTTGVTFAVFTDHARIDQIVDALTLFVIESTVKYMKGHLEHGGNITDRDMRIEMMAETIDLFWYNNALKWQTEGFKVNQHKP